jgi:hypothetical protein
MASLAAGGSVIIRADIHLNLHNNSCGRLYLRARAVEVGTHWQTRPGLGLAWLVQQVKALGFRHGLGLWCAPFWIPALPSWRARLGHCCLQDAAGAPLVAGDKRGSG